MSFTTASTDVKLSASWNNTFNIVVIFGTNGDSRSLIESNDDLGSITYPPFSYAMTFFNNVPLEGLFIRDLSFNLKNWEWFLS